MKRKLSLLLAVIMLLSMTVGSVMAKGTSVYTDVPSGAYYEEHLLELTEKGAVIPAADGKFGPNIACTRAEFVTYLWRAAGAPAITASNPFADVVESAEYAEAVAWAQNTGVTAGKKDGTFGVNDTVTRAQMVTFLHRFAVYMDYPGIDKTADVSTFADANTLPSHSRTTMPWGVAIGMVTGTKQNTLNHGGLATRAHAIAFIGRLLDAVEKATPVTPTPSTPATPSVPSTPATPSVPSTPTTPSVPSTPSNPGTSSPESGGASDDVGGAWVPEEGELDRDF